MPEQSITAYEDLPFAPMGEGSPAEFAVLWGDPATGPVAIMVRFPQGYTEPWHHHTANYHAVIVKGDFQTRDKDKGTTTDVYGPGAYVFQPGGGVHSEVNAGKQGKKDEMVALVYLDGPLDAVPAK